MLNIKRRYLAWVLFIAWLAFSAFAYWWFQFRYVGAFSDHWATFNGEVFAELKVKPQQADALVIHFVQPDCPCSRFSVVHIQSLEKRYGKHVEFIDFLSLDAGDPRQRVLSKISVPAGPSVAIWNQEGELAYFGPYSGGNFCGEGTDFVSLTLGALAEKRNPRWINQEAVGCYCSWALAE